MFENTTTRIAIITSMGMTPIEFSLYSRAGYNCESTEFQPSPFRQICGISNFTMYVISHLSI